MNRNVVYEAINSVSATKQMKQKEGIQMDRARFVFLWLDGGVVAQLIPILNVPRSYLESFVYNSGRLSRLTMASAGRTEG